MKKAILLLFVILVSFSSYAGGTGEDIIFITGNVSEAGTNENLAGVEVRVKGTAIVAYTDFDGNFFLPELPSGTYELSFRYIGCESSRIVKGDCHSCPAVSVQLSAR